MDADNTDLTLLEPLRDEHGTEQIRTTEGKEERRNGERSSSDWRPMLGRRRPGAQKKRTGEARFAW